MQLGEMDVRILHRREGIGRLARRLLVAVIVSVSIAWPAGEPSAQGLFDVLFGWLSPPRQPLGDGGRTPGGGSGRPAAFCVRLCDGRYFPVHHRNAATPVQLCSALCPASKTKVFWGSEIDHASAQD